MTTSIALVAMMGMLVTFGLPLLLVAVILFYKHRKARITHETIVRLAAGAAMLGLMYEIGVRQGKQFIYIQF